MKLMEAHSLFQPNTKCHTKAQFANVEDKTTPTLYHRGIFTLAVARITKQNLLFPKQPQHCIIVRRFINIFSFHICLISQTY